MVAQQTTAAALAPFTTATQAVGTDLQILSRSLSSITAQSAYRSRQITTSLNTTAATSRAAAVRMQPRQASYPAQRVPAKRSPAARKNANAKKAGGKDIDKTEGINILPAAVLARLTPDQSGLQKAAQSEALKAPVGETIFWHLDGREGTAMAENEGMMGGYTCRNFVQTLALEDYFEKVSVTACRTENGNWTHSF